MMEISFAFIIISKFNYTTMKKINSILFYLLISVFLFGCSGKNLSQESAEKAIKEFVASQKPIGTEDAYPFEGVKLNTRGFYNVNTITGFEELNQFNKTTATLVANFKFRSANVDIDLSLEYTFTRNENKEWVLIAQKPIRNSGDDTFVVEKINKVVQQQ